MTEEIKNEAAEVENVTAESAPLSDKEKSESEKKKKLKKLESELAEKEKALEEVKAALAEYDDKYKRLYAEYENFRKRSAKEKENIYADACADTLESILPIGDTLERAVSATGDAEQLHKGIEMVLKSFSSALEKLGVKETECMGAQFDPNIHNAFMHIEDESYGENEIVEVLMKGYERNGKIIRHAMVKVAN